MSLRPRRSVLYMPGSNARAIEKARTLPADCIVLDLEDSVAPDAKPAARVQACAAVEAGGFGPREVGAPGREALGPGQMTWVGAAGAYGLDFLDGVYNDIADAEGFAREWGAARDLGFDGKPLIHPSQIATANTAFTPGAEEVAQA